MSLAFVISLEKPLPESAAASKSGKALARESERLDTAARCCGVSAMTALLSESLDTLKAQLLADGFDPSRMRLAAEQWYPTAEGLKTVRGLMKHVNEHLNDFKQPNPILRDLKAAEAVLLAAETAGVKFHFTKADI